MVKRVFIIHGWGGKPEHGWYLWLKSELEKKGFEAYVPEMPNTETPTIEEWVPFLKGLVGKPDEDTRFVGHSVGCQAILRYLEALPKSAKVGGVVFVAPWMELDKQTIEDEGEEVIAIAKPWVETPINWAKVLEHTNKFVAIFSDNDPYVPLSNSKIFESRLKAKIIIEKKKYHFDQASGITKLPSILKAVLEIAK